MLKNTGVKKDTGVRGETVQTVAHIIVEKEKQTFLQRLFILMTVKKAKYNSSHFKRKFGTNINDSENFFSLFLFPSASKGFVVTKGPQCKGQIQVGVMKIFKKIRELYANNL